MGNSSGIILARLQARSRVRQWQLIDEVARLGSVQRAAALVGMSQPAATQALAEIERLLGFDLFERHAKGTRLTAVGESILPKIRTALNALSECADVVGDLLDGGTGDLRIGAIEAGIGGLLEETLGLLTQALPALTITVIDQSPQRLLHDLTDGAVDVLLLRQPAQLPAGTVFEELRQDDYCVACSPRHPLAGCIGVRREDLARQTWLAAPKASVGNRDFDAFWDGTSPPKNLCRVASRALTLSLMLVEERQALMLIPRNIVRHWLAIGVLAEIPGKWGPKLDPLGALYLPASAEQRGPLKDLLRLLRDHYRDRAPINSPGHAVQ